MKFKIQDLVVTFCYSKSLLILGLVMELYCIDLTYSVHWSALFLCLALPYKIYNSNKLRMARFVESQMRAEILLDRLDNIQVDEQKSTKELAEIHSSIQMYQRINTNSERIYWICALIFILCVLI